MLLVALAQRAVFGGSARFERDCLHPPAAVAAGENWRRFAGSWSPTMQSTQPQEPQAGPQSVQFAPGAQNGRGTLAGAHRDLWCRCVSGPLYGSPIEGFQAANPASGLPVPFCDVVATLPRNGRLPRSLTLGEGACLCLSPACLLRGAIRQRIVDARRGDEGTRAARTPERPSAFGRRVLGGAVPALFFWQHPRKFDRQGFRLAWTALAMTGDDMGAVCAAGRLARGSL
jgi:hypothetical protein